jgi:hypothetical protein
VNKAQRWIALLYFGGAIILIPWILLLYRLQAPEGIAFREHLVGYGMWAFMVIGLVTTAHWCKENSHYTVIAGMFTAAIAFITAWFSTVSSIGTRFDFALIYALVVQIPITLVCLWTVRRLFRPLGVHAGPPSIPPYALLVGIAVVVPLVLSLSHSEPRVVASYHLRLLWVGLDVFELLGMAWTAYCLFRGLPSLVVAASLTGALLFADAWFNIIPSRGLAERQGLLMALVEVPMSVFSYFLAAHEVSRWPEASPRPPWKRSLRRVHSDL